MDFLEIAILICCCVIIVLLILILAGLGRRDRRPDEIINTLNSLSDRRESDGRALLEQASRQGEASANQLDRLGRTLTESQTRTERVTNDALNRLEEHMNGLLRESRESLSGINTVVTEKLDDKLGGASQALVGNITELGKRLGDDLEKLRSDNRDTLDRINGTVNEKLDDKLNKSFEMIVINMSELGNTLRDSQSRQEKTTEEKLEQLRNAFDTIRSEINATLTSIRNSNSENMERLRRENRESLDKINDAVNEKLQKTLDDKIAQSFNTVNQRLKDVYEGLGEMKNVAGGVADLKNVLSNVKTRGILGEIQLSSILEEILAPGQYETQIQLSPDDSERVDFAVKLPGQDERGIYLPIDSKFPGDTYSALQGAYESGEAERISAAKKTLTDEIRRCARSISEKYVKPPYTTNFAIMFLPFEGLYAEVVNLGLIEALQRDFKVNIAGPSTMAAMLNSLRMGFATLAIQKKSGEVWAILGAAKTEFAKFEEGLVNIQKRLRLTDSDLDSLIGRRTRAINRKLASVERLEEDSSAELLELE